MLISLLLGSALAAQTPKTSSPAPDSPEFVSKLNQARNDTSDDSVPLMVVTLLAGASWDICPESSATQDEWMKRVHLSDSEEAVFMGLCLTFAFGQRKGAEDMREQVKQLIREEYHLK